MTKFTADIKLMIIQRYAFNTMLLIVKAVLRYGFSCEISSPRAPWKAFTCNGNQRI